MKVPSYLISSLYPLLLPSERVNFSLDGYPSMWLWSLPAHQVPVRLGEQDSGTFLLAQLQGAIHAVTGMAAHGAPARQGPTSPPPPHLHALSGNLLQQEYTWLTWSPQTP